LHGDKEMLILASNGSWDAMIDQFDEVENRDLMAISGVLNSVKYYILGLKMPSYVMKL
jgi:hypothetical protein